MSSRIGLWVYSALFAIGALLVLIYLALFDNPPYPPVLPVAYWFSLLCYIGVLWLLRALARGERNRRQIPLAIGITAIITLSLHLAGHVGEQQRQAELQQRHLTD